MRVRIARQTYHQRYGRLEAGAIVDVADDVGQHWLARGIASPEEPDEAPGAPDDEASEPADGQEEPAPEEGAQTIDREDAAPLLPEDAPRRRRTSRA